MSRLTRMLILVLSIAMVTLFGGVTASTATAAPPTPGPTPGAGNQNTVQVPDYIRWDATVAYHQPKYDVRFNLLNITNRLNYESVIPSDRGRSVPSLDRTALVTLTYRF